MAMDWAEDPELVATFRAEVDERLAALSTGLLALESHPAPRQLVAALFRDAHTVKGSARMLGALDVLHLAHRAEDLLGAIRDSRLAPRRDLIDLLLVTCDAMARAMPAADQPLAPDALQGLLDVLGQALAGEDPIIVPGLAAPDGDEDGEDPGATRLADSVRVRATKVYHLLDAVGEAELDARRLERTAARLTELVAQAAPEQALGAALRELRELAGQSCSRIATVREQALGLALVPVGRVFAGLPRLVRDLAAANGKEVTLVLSGESVELDKQVLDALADVLRHLVINSVDHGCEEPATRLAAGKAARATVAITARSAGGTAVVEVSDDGAGIDENLVRSVAVSRGLLPADSTLAGPGLHRLLFQPGFSTAGSVTETSGRGVGLDVVALTVGELGGQVEVGSLPGQGTRFTLTLPVTLGVLRCLIARVGAERYALPLAAVSESVSLAHSQVHELAGRPMLVRQGSALPLLDLASALGVTGRGEPRSAVIVGQDEHRIAWAVDALEGEWELVAKDLGGFLGRLPVVSGATIDGDGTVLCVIDPRELALLAGPSREVPQPRLGSAERGQRPARVLLVEDSIGVRELERAILEAAGYDVLTAVDGAAGAERLRGEPVDAVISDVEMPGLDGFELTRTIRRTPNWEQVPVIIMTSRGDAADQQAGMEAGADAYLLKSSFDSEQLVGTVRRLVGR